MQLTSPHPLRPQFLPRERSRYATIVLVTALHLAAIYVLTLQPAREAMKQVSAMMVTLIREQPKVEPLPTELPKPKPVKIQPQHTEPVPAPVVATTPAPADITATPPAPQPPAAPMAAPAPTPAAVTPPRFDADYLDNPAPVYPALSRRMGEEGKVLLRVFVEANGTAGQLEVRTSSGSQRLDHAAIEAVRRWKFAPAKQGDKTVAAWVLVPINFSLRNA